MHVQCNAAFKHTHFVIRLHALTEGSLSLRAALLNDTTVEQPAHVQRLLALLVACKVTQTRLIVIRCIY